MTTSKATAENIYGQLNAGIVYLKTAFAGPDPNKRLAA